MDWTLDLVFAKDIVEFSHESRAQYLSQPSQGEDRMKLSHEQTQPTAADDAA
ncbi:MAG TPA: hypothetical protein VJW20_09195 [Candidatus Angelobacter sp.]|nr:hypothetical protein [Candidatus Angelobacter sp.]